MNLIRLSKINELPPEKRLFAKSSYYKMHHLRRYPRLFVKVGGALFIDLHVLKEIAEAGRGKEK